MYILCSKRAVEISQTVYRKAEKMSNVFIYRKTDTLQKVRQFMLRFYIQKRMTLYVMQFFMKILQLVFIYKKHDTQRYVTFLCTKRRTLSKKQDNLRYVFIYKIWTLCITRFFIELLKLAEGEGNFYTHKKMHFALHFYIRKTMHFALRFYIQKALHFVLHLYI